MSALIGFLSGVGEAGVKLGTQHMKFLDEEELLKQRAEIEMQKEERLLSLKSRLEDQGREALVSRVDKAAGAIADKAVDGKRALVGEGIVDKEAWTPEQQAAVDQSLEADRTALIGDSKVRTQAAIQTGDISPKDAAVLGQKDEATIYKAMWEQAKEEGRNNRADARIAAQSEASDKRLAYLFSALEKKGAGRDNADLKKEALRFVGEARKEVASEATNLRLMYQTEIKDASSAKRAQIEAEYKPKFAEIERKRADIEQDFNSLRADVGLPARTAPKTEAKPDAKPRFSELPAGSKKIGTSGGKAVYQTPDGKKIIED
jgi:hypothetical protein